MIIFRGLGKQILVDIVNSVFCELGFSFAFLLTFLRNQLLGGGEDCTTGIASGALVLEHAQIVRATPGTGSSLMLGSEPTVLHEIHHVLPVDPEVHDNDGEKNDERRETGHE